jgi:CHAD domain-containing protein
MKFEVGSDFDLPDLREEVGQSVRQPERIFTTSYFDTPDLRLWNRGVTLRHLSSADGRGTWTVKVPETEGSTSSRREISWLGAKDQVPAEARGLLRGLIRRAHLDCVAETSTTRLPWALCDHAGNQWAELHLDHVTVDRGPQDGLCYRQVEVEARDKNFDDRAQATARALRRAGAEPDDQPKLARVLGRAAGGRQPPRSKSKRAPTAAEVLQDAICDGLERLLDFDYRLRIGADDPDAHDVHQARVATRRLRSNLKTARVLVDPIWLRHAEGELRWIGAALGAVRDTDILQNVLISADPSKRRLLGSDGLTDLRPRLDAQRVDVAGRLEQALASDRYVDLLDRLHAAASRPPLTNGSGNLSNRRKAKGLMAKMVGERWRQLERKVEAAGRSPSGEELHRIRVAAKNLRYACELSQPVIGKPAAKTARLAKDIQTTLGRHHDASSSIEWLAGARSVPTGRAAFAAGTLAAEQDRRRRKLTKEWRHRWAELSRSGRQRWLT